MSLLNGLNNLKNYFTLNQKKTTTYKELANYHNRYANNDLLEGAVKTIYGGISMNNGVTKNILSLLGVNKCPDVTSKAFDITCITSGAKDLSTGISHKIAHTKYNKLYEETIDKVRIVEKLGYEDFTAIDLMKEDGCSVYKSEDGRREDLINYKIVSNSLAYEAEVDRKTKHPVGRSLEDKTVHEYFIDKSGNKINKTVKEYLLEENKKTSSFLNFNLNFWGEDPNEKLEKDLAKRTAEAFEKEKFLEMEYAKEDKQVDLQASDTADELFESCTSAGFEDNKQDINSSIYESLDSTYYSEIDEWEFMGSAADVSVY